MRIFCFLVWGLTASAQAAPLNETKWFEEFARFLGKPEARFSDFKKYLNDEKKKISERIDNINCLLKALKDDNATISEVAQKKQGVLDEGQIRSILQTLPYLEGVDQGRITINTFQMNSKGSLGIFSCRVMLDGKPVFFVKAREATETPEGLSVDQLNYKKFPYLPHFVTIEQWPGENPDAYIYTDQNKTYALTVAHILGGADLFDYVGTDYQRAFDPSYIESFKLIGQSLGRFYLEAGPKEALSPLDMQTWIHQNFHWKNLFFKPDKQKLSFTDRFFQQGTIDDNIFHFYTERMFFLGERNDLMQHNHGLFLGTLFKAFVEGFSGEYGDPKATQAFLNRIFTEVNDHCLEYLLNGTKSTDADLDLIFKQLDSYSKEETVKVEANIRAFQEILLSENPSLASKDLRHSTQE